MSKFLAALTGAAVATVLVLGVMYYYSPANSQSTGWQIPVSGTEQAMQAAPVAGQAQVQSASGSPEAFMVYVTPSKKYHLKGCRFAASGQPMTLKDAVAMGASPCMVCKPNEAAAAKQVAVPGAAAAAPAAAAGAPMAPAQPAAAPPAAAPAPAAPQQPVMQPQMGQVPAPQVPQQPMMQQPMVQQPMPQQPMMQQPMAGQQPMMQQPAGQAGDFTVYVTKSKKMHLQSCRFAASGQPMLYSQAVAQGYSPCGICRPSPSSGAGQAPAQQQMVPQQMVPQQQLVPQQQMIPQQVPQQPMMQPQMMPQQQVPQQQPMMPQSGQPMQPMQMQMQPQMQNQMQMQMPQQPVAPAPAGQSQAPAGLMPQPAYVQGVQPINMTPAVGQAPAANAAGDASIVYVTKSKKMHRQSCRFAASGQPMPYAQAVAQGYTPCGICRPTGQ